MKERLFGRLTGASFADEAGSRKVFEGLWKDRICDGHAYSGCCTCESYREQTGDGRKCLIASTASPYKFAKSVLTAIDPVYEKEEELDLLQKLPGISGRVTPQAIRDILDAKVLHATECDADQMKETVKKILKSIKREVIVQSLDNG